MSSKDSTEADIKFIEESIDYDRTPRPLIMLKLSASTLFIGLIILAAV